MTMHDNHSYQDANKAYWEKGYVAPNVDACVFRFYGRILKQDFGLAGDGETLLDIGCGQGSAVEFFAKQGFDAWGCDISETDIGAARIRYPHIARKFSVCDTDPTKVDHYCTPKKARVVVSIQTLYYLSDHDFAVCMEKLYAAMEPGAVFYATMMGEQCEQFFKNSTPAHDGLRRVSWDDPRLTFPPHYMSFIKDADHLRRKFAMFQPKHVGCYSQQYRNDDGNGFHWTFCGTKPA
jgi:cyclopropane fatty-acyl-phospholipid synthase-like methyltransferase